MTNAESTPAQTTAAESFPSQLNVGQLPGYQLGRDVTGPREPERRTPLPSETMPELSLTTFDETPFNGSSWLDIPADSMADNPLLRGLLLELPPRGTQPPSPEWLNRWFEATRAVLDLIYVRR